MSKLIVCIALLPVLLIPSYGQVHDFHFYVDVMTHASKKEHRYLAHSFVKNHIIDSLSRQDSLSPIHPPAPIQEQRLPGMGGLIVSWQLIGEKQADSTMGIISIPTFDSVFICNDQSYYLQDAEYGELFADRWLGAVYTNIFPIPGSDSSVLCYGYNRIDARSSLYVIDVLVHTKNGIHFGAPIFENDNKEIVHRLIWKVANGAYQPIQISDNGRRIVASHLVAVPYQRGSKQMVHVPDGTYDVWQYEQGIWRYKERLFEPQFQKVPIDSSRMIRKKKDLFGREVE